MSTDHPEDFYIRKLFEETEIKEVMKTDPIKIHEKDNLSKAEKKFLTEGISHLLIVDKDERLTGLITPKYLYKAISPKKFVTDEMEGAVKGEEGAIIDGSSYYDKGELDAYFVTSIMMKNPFTLKPEHSVGMGVLYMARKNVSCIPIIDDDRHVAGIFTTQEVSNFLGQILTE